MGSLFGGLFGGIGSLLGGFLNSNAYSQYGNTITNAANNAAHQSKVAGNTAAKGYTTAQGYLNPYATQGGMANTLFSNAIGVNGPGPQASYFNNFQYDPGYQATLQRGIQTAQQGGAGTGAFNSGGTLKALMSFGQLQEDQQFQNRLAQLQGLGNQGFQASQLQGNDVIGAANAKAGGILGAANAKLGGALGAGQMNLAGQGAMNQGITGLAGSVLGGTSGQTIGNDLSSYFKQFFNTQQPQVSGYMPSQYGNILGG